MVSEFAGLEQHCTGTHHGLPMSLCHLFLSLNLHHPSLSLPLSPTLTLSPTVFLSPLLPLPSPSSAFTLTHHHCPSHVHVHALALAFTITITIPHAYIFALFPAP